MFRKSAFIFASAPLTSAKLRRDILLSKWVIFNPNRRDRPNQFEDFSSSSDQASKKEEEERQMNTANSNDSNKNDPERQQIISKCPFCPGKNENLTPDPVLLWDEDGNNLLMNDDANNNNTTKKPWALRVVPNLYPAVTPLAGLSAEDAASLSIAANSDKISETHHHIQKFNALSRKHQDIMSSTTIGNTDCTSSSIQEQKQERQRELDLVSERICSPIWKRRDLEIPAFGFHEVVIETPEHFLNDKKQEKFRFSESHVRRLLRAWHARGRALQNSDPDTNMLRHIMYFKNSGRIAGASLEHQHSQIVALPIVSQETRRVFFDVHLNYFLNYQRNVFDDVLAFKLSKQDNEKKNLIVASNEHFIAFVPFAASSPYLVRILSRSSPTRPATTHFENETKEKVDALANLTAVILKKLDILLDKPDFNIVLTTPPLENFEEKKRNEYSAFRMTAFTRYWLTITPRLGVGSAAGFELGSGINSNSSMPEESATELRSTFVAN